MRKENRHKYCKEWELLSLKIRYEVAKNMCQMCGLTNGFIIERFERGRYRIISSKEIEEITRQAAKAKISIFKMCSMMGFTRVILTVAHLDHDESNNEPSNLKALCQRCHLNHDRINNRSRLMKYKSRQFQSPSCTN